MTDDPHGYKKLYDDLVRLETELRSLGRPVSADRVRFVRGYCGGSPSEYLGETRIALQSILSEENDLDLGLRTSMQTIIGQINEGFRRVGGA